MEKVDTTGATRFVLLNDRDVDVLVGGETYTIERCSNEVCQTMFALMPFPAIAQLRFLRSLHSQKPGHHLSLARRTIMTEWYSLVKRPMCRVHKIKSATTNALSSSFV